MLKRWKIKAVCLSLLLLCSIQVTSLFAQDKAQKLDTFLSSLHEQEKLNGVILIAENGKIVFRKGYGFANFETQLPITASTPFNLASVSKQFTSMGIMILQERGKLDYDDPIIKYLPDLNYPDITIRHLLNHLGGLEDYMALFVKHNWDKDKIADNDDLINLFSKHAPKLRFKPGDQFQYSNTGYILLASIIHKASGHSFDLFLKQNIFEPLGMKNSFAYNLKMDHRPDHMAIGYRIQKGNHERNDLIYLDGVMGDGNVYSSADDLFIWDQALYTEKLVRKSTLEKAFTPGRLNDGKATEYGFGWGISNNGNTVSHGGGWVGFRTFIRRDLDARSTIIFLDNGTQSGGSGIMEAVNNFMADGDMKDL